uniref:HTH OST-type domain-containing protein n=1 Tax=Alexandrium catenella TaxID=2925 RepID=A0A7S1RZZ4_ALECA
MLEEQLAQTMPPVELPEHPADELGPVSDVIVPVVPKGLIAGTLPAGVASRAPSAAAAAIAGSSFAGVAPSGIAPEELTQGGSYDFDMEAQPPVMVDPDGPAARRQRAFMYAAGWRAKGRGKGGYFSDLVWTPTIQAAREGEKKKETEMARALFNSLEMHHGGNSVTLSQIGSDFKVAQMKKDPMFKNIRLLDILRQYEDVFELTPDGLTGGWTVKLQPGAQAALPDAEAMLEQELRETDLALPDRIDNPAGPKEKMQALRVELLHALSRRGNRVPLQELGQEPRVQQRKQGLHQAKKLVDFIRLFPMNFRIVADDMQMIVETASPNVSDQSMIEQSIFKNNVSMNQFSSKGKGGPKGCINRGRPMVSPYPPNMMAPPFMQPPVTFTPPPEAQARGFSPQVDAATLAALMQAGALQAPAGYFAAMRPL